MIAYDGFKVFGMATLLILIIIYLLFSIIRRVIELRKSREDRINEKLQKKYDKEVTREEREAAIAYLKGYRKIDEDLHNASPKDSVSHHATNKCLKYWDMAIKALEKEPYDDVKPENEDLTNEEKFFKDWGKRPFYNDRFEYFCPAEIALLLPSRYDDEFISKGCIGLDLDLSNPNRCKNCKKRFWKSKYKKPEKGGEING